MDKKRTMHAIKGTALALLFIFAISAVIILILELSGIFGFTASLFAVIIVISMLGFYHDV